MKYGMKNSMREKAKPMKKSDKHMDVVADKALIKKMVKPKALRKGK